MFNPSKREKQKSEKEQQFLRAVAESDTRKVQQLVQNIDFIDENGCTPLWIASQNGHTDTVQYLKLAGANIDHQRQDGSTPLFVASHNGHTDIVQKLVSVGANIDHQMQSGATPLLIASQNGHTGTVQYLVSAGANIDLPFQDGRKAEDVAKTPEIAALIRNHSAATATSSTRNYSNPTGTTTGSDVSKQSAVPSPSSINQEVEVKAAAVASSPLTQDEIEAFHRLCVQFNDVTTITTEEMKATQESIRYLYASNATHEYTLKLLVGNKKDCPSLIWMYPKKKECRHWLSNPSRMLFQDVWMLVFVCPVTLRVVKCGPDGMGWEIRQPKTWVKKYGPALLCGLAALQTAIAVGRFLGFPAPCIPSEAFAAVSGDRIGGQGFGGPLAQQVLDSMIASVYEIGLAEGMEWGSDSVRASFDGEKPTTQKLSAKKLTENAYAAVLTFLTTGENLQLGPLHVQLEGEMERVGPSKNGNIEWVSVDGKDAWLAEEEKLFEKLSNSNGTLPSERNNTSPSPLTPTPVFSMKADLKWLKEELMARGLPEDKIQQCCEVLAAEGFTTAAKLSKVSPDEFSSTYLRSLGITSPAVRNDLLEVHTVMHQTYLASSTAPPPIPTTLDPQQQQQDTATFATAEKEAMQEKLERVQKQLEQQEQLLSKKDDGDVNVNVGGKGGGSQQQVQMQQQSKKKDKSSNQNTHLADLRSEMASLQRQVDHMDRCVDGAQEETRQRLEDLESKLEA